MNRSSHISKLNYCVTRFHYAGSNDCPGPRLMHGCILTIYTPFIYSSELHVTSCNFSNRYRTQVNFQGLTKFLDPIKMFGIRWQLNDCTMYFIIQSSLRIAWDGMTRYFADLSHLQVVQTDLLHDLSIPMKGALS